MNSIGELELLSLAAMPREILPLVKLVLIFLRLNANEALLSKLSHESSQELNLL